MTAKKAVIVFNGVLFTLLTLLLAAQWRALHQWPAVDAGSREAPLSPVTRPEVERRPDLAGLFGPAGDTDIPPAGGPVAEIHHATHVIRLEGIVMTGRKKMAVVALLPDAKAVAKSGPEKRKVFEGDELFAFTVIRIESHEITLLNRADRREIKLVIFKTNVTEG